MRRSLSLTADEATPARLLALVRGHWQTSMGSGQPANENENHRRVDGARA